MLDVEFTKTARKMLRALDQTVGARIVGKIRAYANNPLSQASNVKALRSKPGFRLRIGDYRVLFTVSGAVVTIMTVYRIGHRKDVYDD